MFLLGVCGLALALLVIGAIYCWVLRPVATVVGSLMHDHAASLASVIHRRDEIGQLARVVETSFAQREELQRTWLSGADWNANCTTARFKPYSPPECRWEAFARCCAAIRRRRKNRLMRFARPDPAQG